MTEEFFTAIRARLTELVKDLRFLHKPTGQNVPPQIIDLMLDRPTSTTEEGDEYPYVRWLIPSGSFKRHGSEPFSVIIDAGIYTDGTISDGNSDIFSLCLALGKITENPRFAPYKLGETIPFTLGQPAGDANNPGIQPHPYYHCRLTLDFSAA